MTITVWYFLYMSPFHQNIINCCFPIAHGNETQPFDNTCFLQRKHNSLSLKYKVGVLSLKTTSINNNKPLSKILYNTLCLSSKILHKHCFQFLLGLTMVPRKNKNNAYARFWRANKESHHQVLLIRKKIPFIHARHT